MMLAMTLVIALVTGGYFVLSKNEADGPQEIAGSFVPGKPKIEMIDSDNSGVPTWQLSNVLAMAMTHVAGVGLILFGPMERGLSVRMRKCFLVLRYVV